MTKTIEPRNFFAIIKKGKLVAAQIEEVEVIAEDNGDVISERALGAKPVTADSERTLSAIAAEINTVALARVAEVELQLAEKDTTITEKEAALAKEAENLTQIKAAIADPALDKEATVAAIVALVAEKERPEVEKKRAAIRAEIAAKQAELDALGEVGDAVKPKKK